MLQHSDLSWLLCSDNQLPPYLSIRKLSLAHLLLPFHLAQTHMLSRILLQIHNVLTQCDPQMSQIGQFFFENWLSVCGRLPCKISWLCSIGKFKWSGSCPFLWRGIRQLSFLVTKTHPRWKMQSAPTWFMVCSRQSSIITCQILKGCVGLTKNIQSLGVAFVIMFSSSSINWPDSGSKSVED